MSVLIKSFLSNKRISLIASFIYYLFNSNKYKNKGTNNLFRFRNSFLKNAKISVLGNNNKILIGKYSNISNIDIQIFGSDCSLIIGDNTNIRQASFWFEDKNCIIEIGSGTLIIQATFSILEDTIIKIGRDSIIAYDVDFRTGDAHSIIDNNSKKRINPSESIVLDNHVWIGAHVTILKGTSLGSDSIIGAGSLVNKKFNKSNIIIAGNPAKEIKDNITWNRKRINDY